MMRQNVTARRLANSPPAPSPSKKPKHAGPQVMPKELARLAKKQLKTIRGLLDGTTKPFPGPYGVDKPVDEVTRFVKKAHGAWISSVSPVSRSVAVCSSALPCRLFVCLLPLGWVLSFGFSFTG